MRCVYHFLLGFILSLIWLVAAAPETVCFGPANTTEYWVGLSSLFTLLGCRAARYTQDQLRGLDLPKDHQAQIWGTVCGPYLCEFPSYLLAAWVLGHNSDTLSVLRSPAATALHILALFCLILSLPCATTLGWKLSNSALPAPLPILATGSLLIISIPCFYRLNQKLIPDTFPLIPVSVVALGLLFFLLVGSRTAENWCNTFRRPHPALGLACLLPAAPLAICLLAFADGWQAGLEAVSFAVTVTLFSVSLAYSIVCCSPLRPKQPVALFLCSFVCGALATYGLFCVAGVHLSLENAKLPPKDMMVYLIFGGLFGLVGPACINKSRTDSVRRHLFTRQTIEQ